MTLVLPVMKKDRRKVSAGFENFHQAEICTMKNREGRIRQLTEPATVSLNTTRLSILALERRCLDNLAVLVSCRTTSLGEHAKHFILLLILAKEVEARPGLVSRARLALGIVLLRHTATTKKRFEEDR